jgi:stage II sporulation protein D
VVITRSIFLSVCFFFVVNNINVLCGSLAKSDTQKVVIPRSLRIRVLLKEYNTKDNPSFTIITHGGVEVRSNINSKKKSICTQKALHIQVKRNELYLKEKDLRMGKANTKEIIIIPREKVVTINDMPCAGHLILKINEKKNKLYIINSIDLDDYVYSVLRYEIYQTWPHEMQKVQAVVSRSYALYCMMNNKRHGCLPYDVKNNNFHQRYKGTHEFNHLKKAVEETKRMVLTYNNEITLAMFDACCGGVVPADIGHFNFKQAPYLARKTACEYCKNYKLYSWSGETTVSKFFSALKNYSPLNKKLKHLGELRGLKTRDRDKAGLLHKFELQGSRKTVQISGKDVWMVMPKMFRSQCITMKKDKEKLFYKGRGFGHHIGLCQRGAHELVCRGWSLKKILAFYYPGTEVKQLAVVLKEK